MSLVHVSGDPSLDFLGTRSERNTTDREELTDPELLARWYVDAGLITVPPMVDATHLDAAVAVREHLFEVITSWMRGARAGDAARGEVNRAAAFPPPRAQLSVEGVVTVDGDASSCLSAVVRSGLQLMRTVEPGQVRWCADSTCTHPFLDVSRAQARRWCDMASCGTRHKQRLHRAKLAARHGDVDGPASPERPALR